MATKIEVHGVVITADVTSLTLTVEDAQGKAHMLEYPMNSEAVMWYGYIGRKVKCVVQDGLIQELTDLSPAPAPAT